MTPSFPLTPQEDLLWDSIRRIFKTSTGEPNQSMMDAYAQSAIANISKLDFKTDYSNQLPLLLTFLKAYPDYIPQVLPLLYKTGYKHNTVRVFLDDVHQHAPDMLATMLPALFKSEKALAMQIPLLMDMGHYLDNDVFKTLDFKLLLKASPEKLLKALTPTPVTWDSFMELAKGLVENEATKDLAKNIACSVGLQVSMAKLKDAKHHGINRYDWVDVAKFWKTHNWTWDVVETLEIVKLRAGDSSLVPDMVYAMANAENPYPEKALDVMNWVNTRGLPTNPREYDSLDSAVQYMYTECMDAKTKDACLAWFNERAENCSILQYAWRLMPPADLNTATQKLVQDVLLPLGITKALLLSRGSNDTQLPGTLPYCGVRTYTLLNQSDLPLGDLDTAMGVILQRWCDEFPKKDLTTGHDYRKYEVGTLMDTLAHDLQEPARMLLRQSNAFKQLLLYTAYLKEVNYESWYAYSFEFMPDLTDKPLSILSAIYPEHQDAWAKVQLKVLDGTFKREDTMKLIGKVLFNQELSMRDIENTCSVLGCKPEVFFSSLQAPENQIYIPESFDFDDISPV